MKSIRWLIFLLVIPVYGCTTTIQKSDALKKTALDEMLTGTWVCDVIDHNCIPSKTTYKKDGTLIFYAYSDFNCNKIDNITNGTWKIQNGNLIIVVQKSTGVWAFTPGDITDDAISEITEHELVLIGPSGKKQYRVKSKQCINGTQI